MCLYSSIGLVFCCFGLLGALELNLKFGIVIFHKLLRPSPGGKTQVVGMCLFVLVALSGAGIVVLSNG